MKCIIDNELSKSHFLQYFCPLHVLHGHNSDKSNTAKQNGRWIQTFSVSQYHNNHANL